MGVAYGSNTDLVRDTLLKVANAHPAVVKQHPNVPAPLVWFREFGDSALNFELRCFIHDINKRLSVLSDLNFAVDKAFREHHIEIPFPQRDLHVRTWRWGAVDADHAGVSQPPLRRLLGTRCWHQANSARQRTDEFPSRAMGAERGGYVTAACWNTLRFRRLHVTES